MLTALVPFLFGLYPITIVLVVNPMTSWWIVARATGVVLAGTTVLLWALRPVWPNLEGRAMTVATWYLLMSWYAFFLLALKAVGPKLDTSYLPAGLAFLAVSALISVAVARPWRAGRRKLAPLGFIGLALVGINMPGIVHANTVSSANWKSTAVSLTSLPAHAAPAAPLRDIYYIVLDGFGRGDTLARLFDADLSPTIAHLRAQGFFVPDDAHSNYAQTALSLSSLLNFTYLDRLAQAVGTTSQDREAAEYLIQHNALMALAHADGYRVVGIGADDLVTQHIDQADVCVCRRYGLDGFEQGVIGLTPWAGLADPWTYAAHRRKILDAFSAIESPPITSGPRFVFAHILVPHPPFVFAADGSPRSDGTVFTLNDGSQFLGTHEQYVEGYRAQVQFAARRVTEVIDHLLSQPGPPPVIVVHGDHGSGSRLRWEDPTATDIPERMGIFAAYYFPGGGQGLHSTMTPISGSRALASDYLGANLPALPDESFFSTWGRPYTFIPVPAGAAASR